MQDYRLYPPEKIFRRSVELTDGLFQLYPLTLRGIDFPLFSFTGLFEMLMLFHIRYDTRFFAGFFESLQRFFEWLLISYYYARHPVMSNPPSSQTFTAKSTANNIIW